ncbi:hypothetical protein SAMN05880574_1572, partial [Chryseobacterium sp. RU37D]
FSGSGNFTTTGVQTVTVTGSGTPINSGTFNYTFSLGSSTCTRNVTYMPGSNPSQICQLGPDDLPYNYVTTNGMTVSITATHTGDKDVNTTGWRGCFSGPDSVYMSNFWLLGLKNGVHTPTTTVYSFSRLITDAEVALSELDYGSPTPQSVTITAQDVNGNDVPVTLSRTKDCIPGNNVINGNTVTQSGVGSGRQRNTSLSIKVSGSYYRKLTVVHNGSTGTYRPETKNATAANLTVCNAIAQ